MFFSAKGFWKPGLIHLFDTNFVLPHVISLLTWASNCMGGAQAEQWDSGLLHFKFWLRSDFFLIVLFAIETWKSRLVSARLTKNVMFHVVHSAHFTSKTREFCTGWQKSPCFITRYFLHVVRHFKVLVFDRSSKTVIFFGRFNQNFNLIGRFFPHLWPKLLKFFVQTSHKDFVSSHSILSAIP